MAHSAQLDRLRQQISAARLNLPMHDHTDSLQRLEAALARREAQKKRIQRQIDHLQACVDELEAETRVIDRELSGLERTLEALLQDILDRSYGVWAESWSPTPIIGFRAWVIHDDGLHGAKVRWTSRHLTARCLASPSSRDQVPHSEGECGSPPCGIYATKDPDTLVRYIGRSAGGLAVGVVALSGRVVDHESGYRAAEAEILALAVVDGVNLLTVSTPEEVDEIFTATRQEIRIRCVGESFALEKAVEYLEEQARRHDQCTLASN